MKVFLAAIAAIMCSCTYNISMAHTQGSATDVIDDTQSPQNNASATLNGLKSL